MFKPSNKIISVPASFSYRRRERVLTMLTLNLKAFPCKIFVGLLVCYLELSSGLYFKEKPSFAISGRSNHKLTGL